jgi:hypothetical protein
MSRKVLASSAGDHTAAEVASDADCKLQNRRNHNDAFGLVEQIFRNAIRDVHNFLEHLTARFQALLLPALIRAEGRTRHKNGYDNSTSFSHGIAPEGLVDSCAAAGKQQLCQCSGLS